MTPVIPVSAVYLSSGVGKQDGVHSIRQKIKINNLVQPKIQASLWIADRPSARQLGDSSTLGVPPRAPSPERFCPFGVARFNATGGS